MQSEGLVFGLKQKELQNWSIRKFGAQLSVACFYPYLRKQVETFYFQARTRGNIIYLHCLPSPTTCQTCQTLEDHLNQHDFNFIHLGKAQKEQENERKKERERGSDRTKEKTANWTKKILVSSVEKNVGRTHSVTDQNNANSKLSLWFYLVWKKGKLATPSNNQRLSRSEDSPVFWQKVLISNSRPRQCIVSVSNMILCVQKMEGIFQTSQAPTVSFHHRKCPGKQQRIVGLLVLKKEEVNFEKFAIFH